jgi:hypothetical protein
MDEPLWDLLGGCASAGVLREFLSGGMGRLAPFPPAGLNGCRAPTPLLLCCGGFLLLCYPKWRVPGGGAVAALCRFFVDGEVGAKRVLIAFCASFGVLFTIFRGLTVLSPFVKGLPVIVSTMNMKLSPGPSRPVLLFKKKRLDMRTFCTISVLHSH